MALSRLVTEVRDLAETANNYRQLAKITEGAAGELGFEHFAILHSLSLARHSTNLIRFDNYPLDWERRLVGRGLRVVDPVLLFARRRLGAFRWPAALQVQRLSQPQLAIFAEAERFGIRQGITIPANVPGEPEGTITFATRNLRAIGRNRLLLADAIGRITFEAARRISGFADVGAVVPHVSERVRECIYWIANGKTDQDVADILGIGLETVRTYVKSAFRLLNVISRAQLVHEALRLGLIDFVPSIPPFG